jgi:hypothetical protein
MSEFERHDDTPGEGLPEVLPSGEYAMPAALVWALLVTGLVVAAISSWIFWLGTLGRAS